MKKIFLAILLIAVGLLIWYLFIKQYDYQFQTTVKYNPGAVYSELSAIRNFTSPYHDDELELVTRKRFKTLTHKLAIDSVSHVELHWDLAQENDSVTAITVSVTSAGERLRNRWDIVNPFQKSIFIDSIKDNLLAFKQRLDNQQKAYGIRIQKELIESPDLSCICSSSQHIPIDQKALEMVRTISNLEDYLLFYEIKLDGNPFLKVTKWDEKKDLLNFDFCFPVAFSDELVETNRIKVKKYPAVPSLKTEFHGNYRLSHIAWHELLFYANKEGFATTGLPLEVFYNNPKNEDSPVNWKADIYLPLSD